MSAERPFVDTNILVYAFDLTAGSRHERARTLVAGLWAAGGGCISVQVLQELTTTVSQKIREPLALPQVSGIVGDLLSWRVHEPRGADVIAAIALRQRHGVSFWDAMVLQAAIALGCTELWSEDFTAGRTYDGVTVRNPLVA